MSELIDESLLESNYAKDYYTGEVGPLTQDRINSNDGTMVTVICISYKHEPFIAEALESFIKQKTTFKFKVFVGEDCGPDNTANIIREYAKKYPDIIIPFIRETNMGAQRNLIDLCQRATSPYIAFCEGDDYWIDENKLQKQFEFMEEHKEIRACSTKTEIVAPEDWHLRSWYKSIDNKIIIPNSIPGYGKDKKFLTPAFLIAINAAHTSSYFFRWNYDLEIPDWYYKGIIGDMPLLLMQLGRTKLAVIPELTSVYRINENSIFFAKDRTAHYLQTRRDIIFWIGNFRRYALENLRGYPIVALENRLKVEVNNLLKTLVGMRKKQEIIDFCNEFPEEFTIALTAYTSFFTDSKALTNVVGWDGYKLLMRNRVYRKGLQPYARFVKFFDRKKRRIKVFIKNTLSFVCYWLYSLVPKEKNVWCFSGFLKKNYMDNTKYLYEWIVNNHPEIKAYWITNNKLIYEQLKSEDKPVLQFRTKECVKILSKASIAFTDHFIMSDFDNISGFNNRTKVVQLWHGVGLKSIGDLKNTDINGVQHSLDILSQKSDSFFSKMLKRFKYFRRAYYRELFEEYFALICPGPERIEQIAKKWDIPVENCIIAGHPRNILLHKQISQGNKILYAPTYRWSIDKEKELVDNLIEAFNKIDNCMQSIGGTFVIRLHPHTWRNYTNEIVNAAEKYSTIILDDEKDIYQSLGTYSMVISDYSSIAYDFVLLDRPVIFHCPDIEEFLTTECNLNYDYNEYSPGPKGKTWSETITFIQEYIANPMKDSEWRKKVREAFYTVEKNDETNSERIVDEIKKRLKI